MLFIGSPNLALVAKKKKRCRTKEHAEGQRLQRGVYSRACADLGDPMKFVFVPTGPL